MTLPACTPKAAPSLRGHEVEDTVAVTLRFTNGAVGTILACDAAPSPWSWELGTGENPLIPPTGRNCFRLVGTEGALALPRLELWRHDEGVPASWHEAIRVRTLTAGPRAALKDQLRHFCGVVRGEHAPRVSGHDGLQTLRTTLAIIESMDKGAPVELEATELTAAGRSGRSVSPPRGQARGGRGA